jgi:hypothetical protein
MKVAVPRLLMEGPQINQANHRNRRNTMIAVAKVEVVEEAEVLVVVEDVVVIGQCLSVLFSFLRELPKMLAQIIAHL